MGFPLLQDRVVAEERGEAQFGVRGASEDQKGKEERSFHWGSRGFAAMPYIQFQYGFLLGRLLAGRTRRAEGDVTALRHFALPHRAGGEMAFARPLFRRQTCLGKRRVFETNPGARVRKVFGKPDRTAVAVVEEDVQDRRPCERHDDLEVGYGSDRR